MIMYVYALIHRTTTRNATWPSDVARQRWPAISLYIYYTAYVLYRILVLLFSVFTFYVSYFTLIQTTELDLHFFFLQLRDFIIYLFFLPFHLPNIW